MLKRGSVVVRVVAVAVLSTFGLNGCAAILGGGSSQGVHISAMPTNATYSIKSSSGLAMGSGVVPNQVRLPRKNEYQIDIAADGFKTQTIVITKSLNGWVWGNLLIGWIVGFIIDFASGAAYKLEPSIVSVNLEAALLDDGREATFAVVTLQDDEGHTLGVRRALMEPSEESIPDTLLFAP